MAKCAALPPFDCYRVSLKKPDAPGGSWPGGVGLLDRERFIADCRMANEEAGSQMACGWPRTSSRFWVRTTSVETQDRIRRGRFSKGSLVSPLENM